MKSHNMLITVIKKLVIVPTAWSPRHRLLMPKDLAPEVLIHKNKKLADKSFYTWYMENIITAQFTSTSNSLGPNHRPKILKLGYYY